jgi:uncharacterized protein (UPF0332 family)
VKPELVKPETALFLEKSHELLERADTMMGVGLTDDAGRAAYLAGLHAAQAFIFETAGRVFRRHSGVQREFSRQVKDDPRVDTSLRTFLSHTYQLKAIADYETGPGSHVSEENAREAIQAARQLVECVTGLLPPNGPTPAATPEPDPSR